MDEQNELISVAMQIILHAGDARNITQEALQEAKKFNFEKADKLIEDAQAAIVEAHKSQTETVQAEMSGEKYEYSMLFSHAQDTLMTIMSEINIAIELIDILKIVASK